jgi:hypothetical protein
MTMANDGGGARRPDTKIELAKVYARTSAKGLTYLTMRLAGVRLLLLPRRADDDGEHAYTAFVAAAPPRGEREGGR